MTTAEAYNQRAELLERMDAMLDRVQHERRTFTREENAEFDSAIATVSALNRLLPPPDQEKSMDTNVTDLKRPEPVGELKRLDAPALIEKANRPYSFQRALAFAAGEHDVDAGLEREYARELEQRQPWRTFKGFAVPLTAVLKQPTHDTTRPTSAKPLVQETHRLELFEHTVDALRTSTVAGRVGVRFIDEPNEKAIIPLMTQGVSMDWMPKDTAAPDSQEGQFSSVEIEPKYAGLKFSIERSALKFARPDIEEILLADARDAITSGLDDAIFSGSGTGDEPQGLFRHPSVTAKTGLSAPDATTFDQLLADLNPKDSPWGENVSWLFHPKTVAKLRTIPVFTGAQLPLLPLRGGPEMLSDRFIVSSGKVPHRGADDADAALGDFAEIIAVTFGGTLDLQVNPWSKDHFERGAVLIVGLVDFNVGVRDPGRIHLLTDAVATP